MAHGAFNSEKVRHMIAMTRAYETFFARIILKLLGYQGEYVDKSTKGWPTRAIDEPMKGPID